MAMCTGSLFGVSGAGRSAQKIARRKKRKNSVTDKKKSNKRKKKRKQSVVDKALKRPHAFAFGDTSDSEDTDAPPKKRVLRFSTRSIEMPLPRQI